MKSVVLRSSSLLSALVALPLLAGCATAPPPYKQPVRVSPPSGRVAVDQSVTIFDASGSQSELFSDGKATLESIVAAMPNGTYQAGHVHFGGYDRETTGVGRFDRGTLARAAKDAAYLQGTTPLFAIVENELAETIGGTSGKAAVVVISDGLVTDYAGRDRGAERTLDAARELVAGRKGQTCFHTVQTGDAPEGAAFLKSLAGVTNCGSARSAASLDSANALQAFSRSVYLGGAPAPAPKPRPTPVASTIPDSDGDGVVDPQDACPGTLKQARVDARGCWSLRNLRFAVNAATIEPGFEQSLEEDIRVLKANPGVRVSIDGHTDSDGSAAYNKGLSERRAASVRDYLVTRGIDRDRLEVKGYGESKPAVPNDSAANKRRNRRVELTVID